MLRIPCPHCGLRDENEFRYGGERLAPRPANPEALDDATWAEHLFYRDNACGPHRERWFHADGCRTWFELGRDTLTHEWVDVEERK